MLDDIRRNESEGLESIAWKFKNEANHLLNVFEVLLLHLLNHPL